MLSIKTNWNNVRPIKKEVFILLLNHNAQFLKNKYKIRIAQPRIMKRTVYDEFIKRLTVLAV